MSISPETHGIQNPPNVSSTKIFHTMLGCIVRQLYALLRLGNETKKCQERNSHGILTALNVGSEKQSQGVCDILNFVAVVEITSCHYPSCMNYYIYIVISLFDWPLESKRFNPNLNIWGKKNPKPVENVNLDLMCSVSESSRLKSTVALINSQKIIIHI